MTHKSTPERVRHFHAETGLAGYSPDPDNVVCLGDLTDVEACATFREHVTISVGDGHDETDCQACEFGACLGACGCTYCAAIAWAWSAEPDNALPTADGLRVAFRRSEIHPDHLYDYASVYVAESLPECRECSECNAEPGEPCRWNCTAREVSA